jgi:hypothetical protein
MCDGAEALAWKAAAVPPLRQGRKVAGLIGSGDELVILWRRMLPRVSSIRLVRGYGTVVYSFKPYQGTSAPRSCHTTSIVRRARDDTLEKAEQPTRTQCFYAAAD